MTNKDEVKNYNIEIKSVDDKGYIKGYGAVFNNIDLYNDIIEPGAFADTLFNSKKNNKKIKFLLNHDFSQPIGNITKIKEDDKGLYFEAQLVLDLPEAQKTYTYLKNDLVDSFSIGYNAVDYYMDEEHDIRHLLKVNLREISVVFNPANEQAKIISVKSEAELPNSQELYKIVDNKENIIDEIKMNELENQDEYKLEGYYIYNINENGDKVLNFQAVENLPLEVKENNKDFIQSCYRAFRKSFDDYTLMSPVCNKNELLNMWDLREYDKYFKKNLNITNNELKSMYKRIVELKRTKNTDDDVIKDNMNKDNDITPKKENNHLKLQYLEDMLL